MTFHALLVASTFLCSLVAGFLFAFAAVVMPGIRRLGDGSFIRAFQVIDRAIQKLDPDSMDETARKVAREAFEPRWNRWNAIRTAFASLTSILLMILLMRV